MDRHAAPARTRGRGEDGTRGPFTDAAGKRWCSEECAEDMAEFITRENAARASEWCPACGFDRHEHADDCPRAAAGPRGENTDGY